MYARTTTVRGDPRAVDEGISYLRDTVWPTLQRMSGCVGMSMLADRGEGRCIVTAAWATDEAMRASAEAVRDVRSRAAEVMRAEEIEVAEWEIAMLHRAHSSGDGAGARVLWADVEPDRMDGMVDAVRMTLLPRMEEIPGFCSTSLMIDRGMGRATMSVTYRDREALESSRPAAEGMREEFAAPMGARITEVAEFDLALAHLRVPEMA